MKGKWDEWNEWKGKWNRRKRRRMDGNVGSGEVSKSKGKEDVMELSNEEEWGRRKNE
ncbi:hypothetical protein [Zymomonas mobilis]|uniref:hypothetical protein n=1 Tax=Zymomonas mobilis TaxID=542 RepID=UPI0039EB19E7